MFGEAVLQASVRVNNISDMFVAALEQAHVCPNETQTIRAVCFGAIRECVSKQFTNDGSMYAAWLIDCASTASYKAFSDIRVQVQTLLVKHALWDASKLPELCGFLFIGRYPEDERMLDPMQLFEDAMFDEDGTEFNKERAGMLCSWQTTVASMSKIKGRVSSCPTFVACCQRNSGPTRYYSSWSTSGGDWQRGERRRSRDLHFHLQAGPSSQTLRLRPHTNLSSPYAMMENVAITGGPPPRGVQAFACGLGGGLQPQ